jgi:hypothetical protein
MTGGPDTGGYTERGTPRVSIAPMMDWTDRHYRYFIRSCTPRRSPPAQTSTATATDFSRLTRLSIPWRCKSGEIPQTMSPAP